ncbi:peptide/nickel transport system ATP-binding protein [Rhizobium skierniewicense]|uniref:Peptide/nickel transport system ATP-binding protein n=1 Tax=Rhizobium skierniewicense TaxID=984260 RepID=A0A7W6CA51_9HYPH|nr:ABC transporter ATP-binding protein [Rhizobium skierniewicense]MBB3948490.1 peptide/nickel transport system ATP-binding protein [Rhizobium skierniewicense]
MTGEPILDVKKLCVSYRSDGGYMDAVRNVSFTLSREKLGIVGESGSGKSTIGRALLKLLPTARITAESIRFEELDLHNISEKEMLKVRGRRMSMILQDPKFSLNPIRRVGDQISEAYLTHFKCKKSEARDKTIAMLEAVQIRDPDRVYDLYPHEVSGGMGQRIMIAMMLLTDPDVVIADEPTSALDVTVRLQVLGILDRLVSERGIGLIMISHDLNLVRNFCDRVLIMYAGQVVESLKASELHNAQHPYTQGLLAAQPRIGGGREPLKVLDRRPEWREPLEVQA